MNKKNPQDIFVNSLKGIYLVDAGAGTGKTYTLVQRYQKLIDLGVKPKDVLMITFTKNAAEQTREEILSKLSNNVEITDLLEAPIMNFHSLCSKLLKNYGTNAPEYLEMDETLSENFSVIENKFFENEFFKKFFYSFKKETENKYKNIYQSLNDNYKCLLSIIKMLCSKGIFPLKSGWFNNSEKFLSGDVKMYREKFDEMNKQKISRAGNIVNNDMYSILSRLKKNLYIDFDSEEMISGKQVKALLREIVFQDESQKELISFIRHIYHSYILYMLRRNSLNFDFMVMFAFIILFLDEDVRKKNQFEYIMVDEFQDTDEIQFQLLMLLAKINNGKANIAVVGDWRQGIYGFRNTTIENITEFGKRMSGFKEIINQKKERIGFDVNEDKIKKIIFEYNYRSSQQILDFSRETLLIPATEKDEIDEEKIYENFKEPLKAVRDLNDLTEIKFYQSLESKDEDGELELILKKISELVNEKKYLLREFDEEGKEKNIRRIQYSDICVLSRTRNFGLKLQKYGLEKGIPVSYEGGLELFASEQGILVLAWLRLMLNKNNIEGWLPILEKEGYTYNEIFYFKEQLKNSENMLFDSLPENLLKFLRTLNEKRDNIIFIIEAILKRYGFEDEFGDSIINEVNSWLKADSISLGGVVYLIENAKAEEFNIELNKTSNAVTSLTIHSAKGLEYPAVFVANCNMKIFPNVISYFNDIHYHPIVGLRFRKIYGKKNDYYSIFNNWKSDLLIEMCIEKNYDEERRLLYVAATRAKQYLYFTSYSPSRFFKDLAFRTSNQIVQDFDYEIKPLKEECKISSEEIKLPLNIETGKKFISVHNIMDEYEKNLIDETEDESISLRTNSDAIEYGIKVHQLAHKLASGFKIKSDIEEVQRIQKFISRLNANDLKSEVDFLFPKEDKMIRGTIDLIAFYDNRIEVIDYKTEMNKNNLEKYKVQISVYKDVVKSIYKDRNVVGKIYFVGLDEVVEV